jgi:hypothetical protein
MMGSKLFQRGGGEQSSGARQRREDDFSCVIGLSLSLPGLTRQSMGRFGLLCVAEPSCRRASVMSLG